MGQRLFKAKKDTTEEREYVTPDSGHTTLYATPVSTPRAFPLNDNEKPIFDYSITPPHPPTSTSADDAGHEEIITAPPNLSTASTSTQHNNWFTF
jgi:hypothetical protein